MAEGKAFVTVSSLGQSETLELTVHDRLGQEVSP
jgi:hypothetical protein